MMFHTTPSYSPLKSSASRLFLKVVFSLILLFVVQHALLAQTAYYKYKVTLRDDKGNTKNQGGLYGHYFNYSDANTAYRDIVNGIKNDFREVSDFRSKHALEGAASGEFEFAGANGMGLVFGFQTEVLIIKHDDGNWMGRKGVTSAGNSFTYSCKKTSDGNYSYEVVISSPIQLDNVDIAGKYKSSGNTRKAFDFNDGYEHWQVHLELPAGTHEEDTRIIVLPYAVDCMTEDTIDYLAPAVYEGEIYHALQDKRKCFGYGKNDPLGMEREYVKNFVERDTIHLVDTVRRAKLDNRGRTVLDKDGNTVIETRYIPRDSITVRQWQEKTLSKGYICDIADLTHYDDGNINDGHVIIIDTLIDYKKPNKDGRYRCVTKVSMEDYHHQYHLLEDPGTCLRISPYKFLQMGAAAVDMELTEEFFENTAEIPIDDNQELRMQFVYGKAEIIEDSILGVDIAALERTIADLRSSGGNILSAVLEAYASPDGNEKTNMDLASRRAQAARQRLMRSGLGSIKDFKTQPQIDTWEETARRLDDAMRPLEAQMIREVLSRTKGTYNAFVEIQKYPTYKEIIKPVLETQCRINFKYKFFTKKKLSPQEAVHAYYVNKHDNKFSNGDYYNMFKELKDSAELDTLTEIVYKRLKRLDNIDKPLATYVFNRMALLSVKRGMPDSTILKPYINEDLNPFRLNFRKTDIDGIRNTYVQNRPEILLNQAIILYQLNEQGRAKFFVDMLRENSYTSPELERLLNFINFRRLYTTDNRTPQEEAEFQKALKYVEESGPDNRAVLYTEFEDLHKQEQAWQYVHLMADANPIKWYLMGLLWAKRDGREGEYPLDELIDSTYVDDGIDVNSLRGYPYYLAYFQHSFDLDKKFMRYYFNEGNISEEMRKKRFHAYKVSRVPIYQKIFNLRKIDDDRQVAKFRELNSPIKKDENASDEKVDENSNKNE